MHITATFSPSAKQANIQLSFETLSKCIESGLLSVQAFHCLDAPTKDFVWEMLLARSQQQLASEAYEIKDAVG